MSALSLFLITKYFEDRQRCKTAAPRKLSTRQRNNEEIANTPACFGYLNIRTLCLLGCMVMNAFTKGPMSCFETLGIEFAESRFDMYRAEAGSIVATMGLLGALILIVMGFVFQRFDDTQLTSGGILLFIVGIFMNTQLDQDVDNAHWKYTLSMFFCYSIGYPICHTALVGLFSKSKICFVCFCFLCFFLFGFFDK
jgi:ceroid-lipofuscinosis MFS transporter 7